LPMTSLKEAGLYFSAQSMWLATSLSPSLIETNMLRGQINTLRDLKNVGRYF